MDKGKGIDPRNWGNAEIPPEDLDIEAQKRAYAILANPMALFLDEAGNPLSIDEQREALEYWGGLRKVPQSSASVSTENNGRPAGGHLLLCQRKLILAGKHWNERFRC